MISCGAAVVESHWHMAVLRQHSNIASNVLLIAAEPVSEGAVSNKSPFWLNKDGINSTQNSYVDVNITSCGRILDEAH
jgi:hypothetical protein